MQMKVKPFVGTNYITAQKIGIGFLRQQRMSAKVTERGVWNCAKLNMGKKK